MGTKECIECKKTYTKSIKYFPIKKSYYNKQTSDPFKPKRVYYYSNTNICIFCQKIKNKIKSKKQHEQKMFFKHNRVKEVSGSIHFCITEMKYYESESEMECQDYSSITQEEIESIINVNY